MRSNTWNDTWSSHSVCLDCVFSSANQWKLAYFQHFQNEKNRNERTPRTKDGGPDMSWENRTFGHHKPRMSQSKLFILLVLIWKGQMIHFIFHIGRKKEQETSGSDGRTSIFSNKRLVHFVAADGWATCSFKRRPGKRDWTELPTGTHSSSYNHPMVTRRLASLLTVVCSLAGTGRSQRKSGLRQGIVTHVSVKWLDVGTWGFFFGAHCASLQIKCSFPLKYN